MEQGSFDTPTGWLTFLHRAYELRLYRYELMLDDRLNRLSSEPEKKTTCFRGDQSICASMVIGPTQGFMNGGRMAADSMGQNHPRTGSTG